MLKKGRWRFLYEYARVRRGNFAIIARVNLDGDTMDKCLVQVDVADEFLFLATTTLANHDREIGEVA
jgi:hypothetical protein